MLNSHAQRVRKNLDRVVCSPCSRIYLGLSEPERLRIQAGMFENFLGGFLWCNGVFDEVRAQNFVSAFEEHKKYNSGV